MTEGLLLAAGTVVTGGDDQPGPGWVQLCGDRIAAVGAGRPDRAPDRDLPDAVLVPGFIDLHVHGGGGAAFTTADPAEARRAIAFHRAHGTTTSLASLVAAPPEALRRTVDALAELVVDGELAGVHLEGPWLSSARCGAHDPAYLRDPDPREIDRLLRGGAVRMVTLAPERPGGLDAVRRIADSGVLAAVGHTDAGYDLARAAIDAGARVGTHLFNAMAPLHHREPGPAAALLADPRVTVELVTDGLHVHPALWDLVLGVAGARRVAAITDAMAAAGMPDGDYRLGELAVRVSGGVARLAGTGTIAGGTATADVLFANIVRNAGLARNAALSRAVAMTATAPARALGLCDVGRLAPGCRGDLVVLDAADLRVLTVYRHGVEVGRWPRAVSAAARARA